MSKLLTFEASHSPENIRPSSTSTQQTEASTRRGLANKFLEELEQENAILELELK